MECRPSVPTWQSNTSDFKCKRQIKRRYEQRFYDVSGRSPWYRWIRAVDIVDIFLNASTGTASAWRRPPALLGRRPEQLDVPAEGKAGVREVRSELCARIASNARQNCAPNCAAAAHREPSVWRSFTIAASAASSVPSCSAASELQTPLLVPFYWNGQ